MRGLSVLFAIFGLLTVNIASADLEDDVITSVSRCQKHGYTALNCIRSDKHPESVNALLSTLSRCDVLKINARTCIDLKSSFMRCEANGVKVSECLPGLKDNLKQLQGYLERCTINGTSVASCL